MSGPENLRGVDYQIACTVLLALRALADEPDALSAIDVESLDDEGEDLAIRQLDGRVLQVQVKKLAEGYNWTPSSLRPILARFVDQDSHVDCEFVTDGSAGAEVKALSEYLAGGAPLSKTVRAAVTGKGLSEAELDSLVGRVSLRTRFYPSQDPAHAAQLVKAEAERLMLHGPFELRAPSSLVYDVLWNAFFDAAKAGASLPADSLLSLLEEAGLTVSPRWAAYPRTGRYYPQHVDAHEIASCMPDGALVLVTGIGGCGKTTFAAEVAGLTWQYGLRPCWVSTSELTEPEDLLAQMATCLSQTGHAPLAALLRTREREDWASTLADALGHAGVALIVDRFESANSRVAALVRNTVAALPAARMAGSLLLTGRCVPDWWPDAARELPRVAEVILQGLPELSALEMLRDEAVGSDDAARTLIVRAVAGHPQCLVMMMQLRESVDVSALPTEGVEQARDWLLRRVIDELPEHLRIALARLSIFDYPAPMESAFVVLGPTGPDLVRQLAARSLVRVEFGAVVTHDALTAVAVSLLTPANIAFLHRAVAEQLRTELERVHDAEGEYYFEPGIRWAAHLEAAESLQPTNGEFNEILDSSPQRLADLFAVYYHGFPYEFEDPTLKTTWARVLEMEAAGLIHLRETGSRKDGFPERLYEVTGMDPLRRFLASCVALRHEYVDHLGYVQQERENHAWDVQGLLCAWEHCIENQPCPQTSRADYEASLAKDARRLAEIEGDPTFAHQAEALRSRIAEGVPAYVVDEPDPKLAARRCPLFGHCCPGGAEQAEECRSEMEEDAEDEPQ